MQDKVEHLGAAVADIIAEEREERVLRKAEMEAQKVRCGYFGCSLKKFISLGVKRGGAGGAGAVEGGDGGTEGELQKLGKDALSSGERKAGLLSVIVRAAFF